MIGTPGSGRTGPNSGIDKALMKRLREAGARKDVPERKASAKASRALFKRGKSK